MKMVKTRIAVCALLLLLLSLVISSLQINQVGATYGWDLGYYHACEIHASDGGNPSNDYELAWMQYACNDIFTNAFEPRKYYYWFGYDYGYYEIGPAYGHLLCYMEGNRSETTVANVLNGIDDCEINQDASTFLYIGHHAYDYWGGAYHYGFVEHGYGNDTRYLPKVWDVNVDGHVY